MIVPCTATRVMPTTGATAGGSGGRSVGRKGESEARTPTVDIATPTQPSVRENPRQGRARVPGDEMPIRLSQGSLSWHRQERRAGLCAARARQPIPCPQDTRVRMTKTGAKASLRKVVTPQNLDK